MTPGIRRLHTVRLGQQMAERIAELSGGDIPDDAWHELARGRADAMIVVQNETARELLSAGARTWLSAAPSWSRADLLGNNRTPGLVDKMHRTIDEIRSQADELSRMLVHVGSNDAPEITEALDELSDAWAALLEASGRARLSIAKVSGTIPAEKGGRPLGEQLSGQKGSFMSFAMAARDAWRHCQQPLRGRHSNFDAFLDDMHAALPGSPPIPGRNRLLADLRNDWPGQKNWK